jgi:hypothetical protein
MARNRGNRQLAEAGQESCEHHAIDAGRIVPKCRLHGRAHVVAMQQFLAQGIHLTEKDDGPDLPPTDVTVARIRATVALGSPVVCPAKVGMFSSVTCRDCYGGGNALVRAATFAFCTFMNSR